MSDSCEFCGKIKNCRKLQNNDWFDCDGEFRPVFDARLISRRIERRERENELALDRAQAAWDNK
jgi:hypothetical protein